MSLRLLVSLSLLAFGACGGGGSIEVARQGIVNGRPHAGHPSVGLVRDESGGFCTGTLVGSRTVLSAAHCIFPSTAYSFELEGQSYPVIRARAHPGFSELLEVGANDIGLFRLGETPPVEPSAVAGVPPSVGLAVTLVGFGVTGEGLEDGEVKRLGSNTIAWVEPKEIGWTGSAESSTSCHGDSGGPAFAILNGEEVQVGVVSRGTGDCGTGEIDTRVDAYRAWLMHESAGDVVVGGLPPTAPAPAPEPAVLASPPGVFETPESCLPGCECQGAAPVTAAPPRPRLELGCAIASGPPSPTSLLALLLLAVLRAVRPRDRR